MRSTRQMLLAWLTLLAAIVTPTTAIAAYSSYTTYPYVYPARPADTRSGLVPIRDELYDTLRRADARATDSRVVRIRRVGTSRSTAFGGSGGPMMQSLNSESAAYFGGLTELPWQIPGGGNDSIYATNGNTPGAEVNTVYAATAYPPHWRVGGGIGAMTLLVKAQAEHVCAIMPRGETHDQIGGSDSGLILPSDYQTVGITMDCMFLKSAGAESVINWEWQHHDSRVLNIAVNHQTGTFDGTLVFQTPTPSTPTPIVFTTPALTFGSNTAGSFSVFGAAATFPAGANGTIYVACKPKYAGAKQYGLLWEPWSEGGYTPSNHYALTGQGPISTAAGLPDFWVTEIDINSFYGTHLTAVQFKAEMVTLCTYLRTLANVPIIFDYSVGSEHAHPSFLSDDTEFDQCMGVYCELVDEGYGVMALNSRRACEEQLGFTRAQQSLVRWSYKSYSAGTAYAVDTVILWTDSNYYRCVTATSAGENPTTHAAKWQDMRWTSGVAYVASDLVIQNIGANVIATWECTEAHTASFVNAPPNPRYWKKKVLYQLTDSITYSPTANGRVHPSPEAQRRIGAITARLFIDAIMGGSGTRPPGILPRRRRNPGRPARPDRPRGRSARQREAGGVA